MKPLPRLALLILALAAGPTQAFEHPETGFAVELPDDFIVDPDVPQQPQYDILVGINPASGDPAPADTNPYVCQAGFQRIPANQGLRQKQINALASDDNWVWQVAATFEPLMEIDSVENFKHAGIVGVQFVTTPKIGPGAENARLVMTMMETPKGRTVLTCTATADGIWPALPVFERIRDGLLPPR
ncbi:MAG: hypothetical protein P0Y65_01110 [Candidatus Devosia phytovorans]|uniref:DUF1795 domain-containing protein n=1 Tax=Candidatus Devosia phytovorans TaxID=3121372 RepID=A0AAJ5VVG1_9HYPH|nr:hypothetical protein [Devosia sp.]WEK04885.1 MAG: hypothetical protein P0Y65_01110 [Devosia sp.]